MSLNDRLFAKAEEGYGFPGSPVTRPGPIEPVDSAVTPPRMPFARRFLWRVLCLVTRLVYRVRVDGEENLPERGGALLTSNHLSFVDGLLLLAANRRFVRFMMSQSHCDHPLVRPLARLMGIIPISSEQRPREMIRSLRLASEAIRQGELVCVFAEGQISRLGRMLPFRRGLERVMKDVDAPVIPVCVDGIWGSVFSFHRRRFFWRIPRLLPSPVTVTFGPALPSTVTSSQVRSAVQHLSSTAWRHRRDTMTPLHRAFIRTARRHPFRFAMGDARAPRVNFLSALARAIYLARRLRGVWGEQKSVGILLPPSVGGALVNFAALMAGKVPVNLNYTASESIIAACVEQCGIETVISSREFLERVKLNVPARVVLLEEMAANPRPAERHAALAMALLLPARWLERAVGCERPVHMDDTATVIFSSGSTGDPKGVVLSHFNVAANVAQLDQVFGLTGRDCLLGVLPFFHSFGFTGTLCLPGTLGVGVAYHPTPLDTEAVGRLVRDYSMTFLLATPTFLQLYLRGCAPADFGSLRMVMAGAEKLPDRLAAAFEEKFGIRPLEGYGCTECAPVVAVNTHDFRAAGFRQIGGKRGTIGHPLPGVSVRVVDPETGAPLPTGQPGLLHVRGPNVMQGYLNRAGQTAEVLREGWYCTGDIAAMDEDGFLRITDRLSRFSKIGGEMIPHIKLEEALHELIGATEQIFVVTSVPDDKKGERLVVLHRLETARVGEVILQLPQIGLPNLWLPRPNQFFHVESIPLLGTGKLDLRRIRELATQFSTQSPT